MDEQGDAAHPQGIDHLLARQLRLFTIYWRRRRSVGFKIQKRRFKIGPIRWTTDRRLRIYPWNP